MPKNKGKGGKSKRKGKNKSSEGEKRELMRKEKDQEYAQVMRILWNCRIHAQCFDGKERLCHVRGKFRKKVWINKDDIILVGLRDYQDGKADVIHKYTADEARQLKALGELPARARIIDTDAGSDDDDFLDDDGFDDDDFDGEDPESGSDDIDDDDDDEDSDDLDNL